MLYLTYINLTLLLYMCITFHIYDHLFLFSLIFFSLEPACKKSCQPIVDKLTDIQTTKSTAEQPQN